MLALLIIAFCVLRCSPDTAILLGCRSFLVPEVADFSLSYLAKIKSHCITYLPCLINYIAAITLPTFCGFSSQTSAFDEDDIIEILETGSGKNTGHFKEMLLFYISCASPEFNSALVTSMNTIRYLSLVGRLRKKRLEGRCSF